MADGKAVEADVEVVSPGSAAASTAMTLQERNALEPFGGPKQFPLAVLSDEQFTNLLERMRVHFNRMKEVQRSLMRPGVHYGIPGKSAAEVVEALKKDGTKVGLFKAGMELLLKLHRYVADVRQTVSYGDPANETSPAIRIESICHVHADSLDGPIVAVGVGVANSWETKYRYRNLQRKCPKCGVPALGMSKFEAKGGPFKGLKPWWCDNRPGKGGCGAEFAPEDPAITGQEVGKMANPEAHDLENTLAKMSAKRSKVDGAINATGSSDLFTQDLEDLSPEARSRVERDNEAAIDQMYGGGQPAGDGEARTGTQASASGPSRPANGAGATDTRPATDKQRGALQALLGIKLGARGGDAQEAALRERTGHGWAELTISEAGAQIGALNELPDAKPATDEAPRPATRATQQHERPAAAKPAAAPAADEPERRPDGALADTLANRQWATKRVRDAAVDVEANFGGRKVLATDDGISHVVGGNEMALLKLSKPVPLDYLTTEQLVELDRYLRSELERKGALL